MINGTNTDLYYIADSPLVRGGCCENSKKLLPKVCAFARRVEMSAFNCGFRLS